MHPQLHVNLLSMLLAVVASFVFGWVWYGPLLGKLWLKLMKLPSDMQPDKKMMIRSVLLGLLGTFLTTYVLVFSTNIWRPSVWGAGTDDTWCMYGFMSGFFTWLGFYVPMLLSSVAWEGRSWRLFGFSAAYYFLNLQIISMIVAFTYTM